ncbi:hypothetical protein HDV00_011589 [Rhizophlyctis rosea]|nr:hypothetical protein HDV00_011589 [Rhizophlyctis rosea]
MEDNDPSVTILQDIPKKRKLEYKSIVDSIAAITGSTSTQFPTVASKDEVICKWSSTPAFKANAHFNQDDIPLDPINIWNGTRQMAMICVSDHDAWWSLPEAFRLRVQNVIAIGLIVEDLRENRYRLFSNVSQNLARLITNAISPLDSLDRNAPVIKVNKIVSDMILTIYDSTVSIIQSDMPHKLEYDVDSRAPINVMFDVKNVRDLLFRCLRNLKEIPNLTLYVTEPSDKTKTKSYLNFRVVSNAARWNAEIEKTFMNDILTPDNLGVVLVHRLCSFVGGSLSTDEFGPNLTGVSMTIRCYHMDAG